MHACRNYVMQLPRFFGLVDLGILTVIAVAVVLPPREMYASDVVKGGEDVQFKLALAEARTIARPEDGRAAEDFARMLGEANQKDWAIDASVNVERALEGLADSVARAARGKRRVRRSTRCGAGARLRESRARERATARRPRARAGRRSACSCTSRTSTRASSQASIPAETPRVSQSERVCHARDPPRRRPRQRTRKRCTGRKRRLCNRPVTRYHRGYEAYVAGRCADRLRWHGTRPPPCEDGARNRRRVEPVGGRDRSRRRSGRHRLHRHVDGSGRHEPPRDRRRIHDQGEALQGVDPVAR